MNAPKIDLFEFPELIPPQVTEVLSKYDITDGDYNALTECRKELEAVGFTFDLYLDAIPVDLRRIEK